MNYLFRTQVTAMIVSADDRQRAIVATDIPAPDRFSARIREMNARRAVERMLAPGWSIERLTVCDIDYNASETEALESHTAQWQCVYRRI
jgi:hypothetical protein